MVLYHIESGLGNQMLDYCDYLASKKENRDLKYYIETIVYEIEECNETVCQWQGYELDRIFDVNCDNIKELFSETEWKEIIEEIRSTNFWKHDWNYMEAFVDVLGRHGLPFENIRIKKTDQDQKMELLTRLKRSVFFQCLKRFVSLIDRQMMTKSTSFARLSDYSFAGHTLSFMYRGAGIEEIEVEVRNTFVFPEIQGKRNEEMARRIEQCEAVSVHLRRGDGLANNLKYYKRGYYKKAVKLIKRRVKNPVFFVFSDPGNIEWAREHIDELGLRDLEVYYIDWNKGTDSYIDMNLMSMCKHNIISMSSFSWWASYLNKNPGKITIAPEPKVYTTDWV